MLALSHDVRDNRLLPALVRRLGIGVGAISHALRARAGRNARELVPGRMRAAGELSKEDISLSGAVVGAGASAAIRG